jgi:renalase
MTNEVEFEWVIVGAGAAGLVLGRALHEMVATRGGVFIILEKSRGVGGRMATRRDGQVIYDHGAQFLKIYDQQLKNLVKELLDQKIITTWFQKERQDFLAAPKGMTQVAKYWSRALPIEFSQKVVKIETTFKNSIHLICESGRIFNAKQVFLTCPLPQSLELLKKSSIEYPSELDTVNYASAVVGLFEVITKDPAVKNFCFEDQASEKIYSVSNQASKKVSPQLAFTVVMNPSWSQTNFEFSEAELQNQLQQEFENFCKMRGLKLEVVRAQVKKWRYSHPLGKFEKPFVICGENQNVFLLGDAFGGPSIQGAITSALSVAKKIFS